MTVNDAVRVTLLQAAEIVDVAAVVTDDVVTVKVALDEPAGTVTLAGTLVEAELSLSDTDRAAARSRTAQGDGAGR